MYWATRYWITSQPAIITSMVMNAVSRINGIEKPSTPKW